MKFDQMTKQQQFDTLRHMREDGGHFVSALSMAWMRADEYNSARLAAAFPDIVARYAPEQPALQLGVDADHLDQMQHKINCLERENDAIGLTRVRHEISQRLVEIRLLLRDGHLKNLNRS